MKDAGWYSEAELKDDLTWSVRLGLTSFHFPCVLRERIAAVKKYCTDPDRAKTHCRLACSCV